jgi:hypothetical protein
MNRAYSVPVIIYFFDTRAWTDEFIANKHWRKVSNAGMLSILKGTVSRDSVTAETIGG